MTMHGALPGVLAEIAEVAGLSAAMMLADQYGGLQVDIPRRAHDRHWLVQCVGREAADQICAHMTVTDADNRTKGARGILIPRGPMGLMRKARRRLADEIRAGKSVREASRIAGLSERTGWYVKAEIEGRCRRSPDQGSLF